MGILVSATTLTASASELATSGRASPVLAVATAVDLDNCPTLNKGAQGGCVVELQRLLIQQGHDPGTVDGDFGPKTDAAVTAFKKTLGMTGSSVGPQTKAALYTQKVTATSSNCPSVLSSGSRGGCVAYVQSRLNTVAGAGLAVDGRFGPATDKAARAFQKARCLSVDGKVGPDTKKHLVANTTTCSTPREATPAPTPKPTTPKPTTPAPTPKPPSSSGLTLTKAMSIPNPLFVGTSVSVKGIITSSVQITRVEAKIVAASGKVMYRATASPKAKTYDMKAMDKTLAFSKLSKGDYTFWVIATPSGKAAETLRQASFKVEDEMLACAKGTEDLNLFYVYVSGAKKKARLCALPNVRASGDESIPGHKYYVAGSNKRAIVRARYSKDFYNMTKAAQDAGITVKANSTYRTHQHQKDLCKEDAGCDGRTSYDDVAEPGTSRHEGGAAIDFNMGNGSKLHKWLKKNAGTYHIKEYSREYWHWEHK